MPFVDFAELKTRVSLEDAMRMLGLTLKAHGNQHRGPCPACKSGGERALVVTPGRGFYCFAKGAGGDQIALVAHIKGCSLPEAAAFLGGNSTVPTVGRRNSTSTVPATVPPAQQKKPGFDPETYAAKLDPAHEALSELGISAETFREWKAGFASTGTNRGRLAIALHDPVGNILGFAGRALGTEQPVLTIPNGLNPQEIIFGAHRVEAGTLYLVRDVLDVLRAYEAGATNCVCFISEISGLQVEMLAALMATKHCDTLELF